MIANTFIYNKIIILVALLIGWPSNTFVFTFVRGKRIEQHIIEGFQFISVMQ